MAYCYECGAQVAEIDVFCPFCGISLKPVAIGDGDDVSMDKTIVFGGGDAVEVPPTNVAENIETPQQAELSVPLPDVPKAAEVVVDKPDMPDEFSKPTGDLPISVTEESFDLKTDSVEIPAEMYDQEIAAQPTISAVETEIPLEAEKVETQVETVVSDNDADLPDPTHIEILKPIQDEPEIPENIVSASTAEEIIGEETIGEEEIAENVSTEFSQAEVKEFEQEFDAILPQTETIEAKPEAENIQEVVAKNDFVAVAEPQIDEEIVEIKDDISDAETLQTVDNPEVIASLMETSAEIPDEFSVETISAEEETPIDENLSADNVMTLIHPSQSLENIAVLSDEEIANFDAPMVEESEVSEPAPIAEIQDLESKPVAEVQDLESKPVAEIQDFVSAPIETNAEVEASISKPEIELAEVETPKSDSVFDSVQIVQQEKRVDEFEQKVAEIESAKANGEPISTDLENQESRSYTTPIVSAENTDGKKASKLKPLDEGTVLNNRYEIVRKIGGGGMGAVYLASDKNLGGVLRAVKEMVQSYIEETQQDKAVSDFKRESLLLTSLEHAAIPTIYDYFFDEKEARFYLVMKYISGGDLAGRLRASTEGKIDEKSVTEWGIQISDVLDYLHKHEPAIVYRDLKPANVMIDGNSGRLMLIDFGIARWINKEEKGVTAVGTMGYAPPELFSGNVEPRSDIYSLGSTMFHLLTGADPQSNPLLIFDFQKNPLPRQINPLLSDQIERILMRAVEYSAEKRFESAGELKKSLEEHLENLKAGRITYGVKEVPVAVGLADELVFCGFCGQKIVATDVFCAFCGSQQPLAQQGVKPISYGGQTATARLTLLNTEELDEPIFSLEKEVNILGRRDPMSNIFPEVDLSKYDPQTKISRRHARIWREGNNYMVEDLGSSNGTILLPILSDTVRLLPHQPHLLTNGDKIKVGDTTMNFIVG